MWVEHPIRKGVFMPRDYRKATERWNSEGGATPQGPATDIPAADARRLRPEAEPPTSPNPRGQQVADHPTKASDAAVVSETSEPPPGQEEQPEEGVALEPGEDEPQEMGESG
jgi:hypothetical protein